jgi:hypothetical protein
MIISPHMEREIRRRALAVKPTNSDETPLFFPILLDNRSRAPARITLDKRTY